MNISTVKTHDRLPPMQSWASRIISWRISSPSLLSPTLSGLSCYALTSTVVVLGVVFGHRFVDVHVDAHVSRSGSLVNAFANQDGGWYKQIVTNGYFYNPEKESTVAFFPLYPLLAASLIRITGLGPEAALLVVAHACLAAAFVLMAVYVRHRFPTSPPAVGDYVLLSLGLMPATLFFRMAYSESLFVLLSILALLAMARRWPLLVVAAIVGLTTAARPVGVALLAPFLLHCWHRSSTRREFVIKTALLFPVACWGIAGYALYQAVRFGAPLAFVQTQSNWGRSADSLSEKLLSLLSYEPIWQVYDRVSPFYWGAQEPYPPNPFFCWSAVNPLYFVVTLILILFGACKRWLSSYETLLALALLLIPYFTRAYEMAMASQARFAAAVFPVYLVLGNILARLPGPLPGGILGMSAFYLGVFSALFATWHLVF
jgi:hypothetical protein